MCAVSVEPKDSTFDIVAAASSTKGTEWNIKKCTDEAACEVSDSLVECPVVALGLNSSKETVDC